MLGFPLARPFTAIGAVVGMVLAGALGSPESYAIDLGTVAGRLRIWVAAASGPQQAFGAPVEIAREGATYEV